MIEIFNDESTNQGFFVEFFRQMLKCAGRQGQLIFLHDNENNILVDEYYSLYQARCYTYKYSYHYFDYEKVILAKMIENPITEDGKVFINYEFVDSKKNTMIQVSDVFVGIMGKLFQFLDGASWENIVLLKSANSTSLTNLAKLNFLIDRSDSFHQMLIDNVNDINLVQQRMLKLQYLTKAVIL